MKSSAKVQKSQKTPTGTASSVLTTLHMFTFSDICCISVFCGGSEVFQGKLQLTEIFLGETVCRLVFTFKYSGKRKSKNACGVGNAGTGAALALLSAKKGILYSLCFVVLDVFPHKKRSVVKYTTDSMRNYCNTGSASL